MIYLIYRNKWGSSNSGAPYFFMRTTRTVRDKHGKSMGKIPKDKKSDLAEKHWEALRLLEEGGRTMKEIARTVGIDYQYFQDLYSGDTEKAGRIAAVFQAEVKKILNKKE